MPYAETLTLPQLDDHRAQAAWRRYWGPDCRPDGTVVVGAA